MPIVNDTKDDIGYDTDPPHYFVQAMAMTAAAAAGTALVVYAALQSSVGIGLAGAALVAIGAVGLDRTLRQRRELLAPRIVMRPELLAVEGRQVRAGAARELGGGSSCRFDLPGWCVVPEPAVFPPGTTLRFCDPAGQQFATVEIGGQVTVSYSAGGLADEIMDLVQPSLVTVSKTSTGAYKVSVSS